MTLAELVKRRRAERALSLREVAKRAGVSFAMVHEIESGTNKDIRVSTVLGLAKALSVNPDVVFVATVNGVK